MSLKAFHIFFIIASIALAVGFGWWAIENHAVTENVSNLWLGIGSLGSVPFLGYYLIRVIGKLGKIPTP